MDGQNNKIENIPTSNLPGGDNQNHSNQKLFWIGGIVVLVILTIIGGIFYFFSSKKVAQNQKCNQNTLNKVYNQDQQENQKDQIITDQLAGKNKIFAAKNPQEQAVWNYYKLYIDSLNGKINRSKNTFSRFSSDYVTQEFVDYQEKITRETKMPPDSILCAQDYPNEMPKNIEIELIKRQKEQWQKKDLVILKGLWGKSSIMPISIKYEKHKWKINRIYCNVVD